MEKISWIQHIRHPGWQPQCAWAHCQDRAHRWHLRGDAQSKRPFESQIVSLRNWKAQEFPAFVFEFLDEVWKFWKSQIFPSTCKKTKWVNHSNSTQLNSWDQASTTEHPKPFCSLRCWSPLQPMPWPSWWAPPQCCLRSAGSAPTQVWHMQWILGIWGSLRRSDP